MILFTKPLARMPPAELARTSKDIGFDGLDLTVRPGGHVDPRDVQQALPEAARVIRDTGLSLPMITTNLTSPGDPTADGILATAHKLDIPNFKTGYWNYDKRPITEQIAAIQNDIQGLAALARKHNMVMGIHNHSGRQWGEAVWDIKEALDRLPGDPCGYYFDPAHATIEGGLGGWDVSLEIALPRLRMIAVKDFVWQRQGGQWRPVWVPLGQGMVRWPEILRRVKKAGFAGPISLHIEYKAEDPVAAIGQDFKALKALLAIVAE